ncbi:hypothetical protein CDAR_613201 [Caerostris darwini]|uniref:Uncharacterized protein n=1 Tax=Caerostris darwini TaxID=1538125 RepID=A0AAV4UL36_9ARAC|nr:hypothetical protein CDAR_613201 [Caerostris darwini]
MTNMFSTTITDVLDIGYGRCSYCYNRKWKMEVNLCLFIGEPSTHRSSYESSNSEKAVLEVNRASSSGILFPSIGANSVYTPIGLWMTASFLSFPFMGNNLAKD